jgi:hypothetical protein
LDLSLREAALVQVYTEILCNVVELIHQLITCLRKLRQLPASLLEPGIFTGRLLLDHFFFDRWKGNTGTRSHRAARRTLDWCIGKLLLILYAWPGVKVHTEIIGSGIDKIDQVWNRLGAFSQARARIIDVRLNLPGLSNVQLLGGLGRNIRTSRRNILAHRCAYGLADWLIHWLIQWQTYGLDGLASMLTGAGRAITAVA